MANDSRRNQYDKRDSLELGDSAEARFKLLALKRGWIATVASPRANIDEHWDFSIRNGNEKYRVDVKGLKRTRRGDIGLQDDWAWIEFHGVRPNERGWLYDGKADLLAFERRKTFVIVKRVDLIELCNRLVNFDARVQSAHEAKYKVYTRRNRPDLLSQIELSKIESIAWASWEK